MRKWYRTTKMMGLYVFYIGEGEVTVVGINSVVVENKLDTIKI